MVFHSTLWTRLPATGLHENRKSARNVYCVSASTGGGLHRNTIGVVVESWSLCGSGVPEAARGRPWRCGPGDGAVTERETSPKLGRRDGARCALSTAMWSTVATGQ